MREADVRRVHTEVRQLPPPPQPCQPRVLQGLYLNPDGTTTLSMTHSVRIHRGLGNGAVHHHVSQ
jgi:hypothetical protein